MSVREVTTTVGCYYWEETLPVEEPGRMWDLPSPLSPMFALIKCHKGVPHPTINPSITDLFVPRDCFNSPEATLTLPNSCFVSPEV